MKPRIGIIPGDPGGIGPELIAKLLADPDVHEKADILLIGDRHLFEMGQTQAGTKTEMVACDANKGDWTDIGGLAIHERETIAADDVRLAEVTYANGHSALSNLNCALEMARDGIIDAITFGPFNKAALIEAGLGHEDDLTVADLVADHRAATPTAAIVALLPESPAFFPKDEMTDKPMRFFVSEIVREKILTHCKQEVPYSSEVTVESFKEDRTKDGKPLRRIHATILVARESQKAILIGTGGKMIKRLATDARKDLEDFLKEKVFLELRIKVDKDWRNDERKLKQYGYFDG